MKTTLVLGASDNPERYSFRALHKLIAKQHSVVAVTPRGGTAAGITCVTSLANVSQQIDTITIYINPTRLNAEIDNLLKLKPSRVIFNPGSESPEAAAKLSARGIQVINDCTLIMLNNDRY